MGGTVPLNICWHYTDRNLPDVNHYSVVFLSGLSWASWETWMWSINHSYVAVEMSDAVDRQLRLCDVIRPRCPLRPEPSALVLGWCPARDQHFKLFVIDVRSSSKLHLQNVCFYVFWAAPWCSVVTDGRGSITDPVRVTTTSPGFSLWFSSGSRTDERTLRNRGGVSDVWNIFWW